MNYLYDLIEENGKTIRENNLEEPHAIPMKTLVEVDFPDNPSHGLRAFVCEQTRDFDGSPTYSLYYSSDFETLEIIQSANEVLGHYVVQSGFHEHALHIIPKQN